MIENINLENILFIDIETVPVSPDYESLDAPLKKLWDKKTMRFRKGEESAADYYEKAGIYAEFGKIICISVGFFARDEGAKENIFRIKSFYGDNEKEILVSFIELLDKHYNDPRKHLLCGHNAKEFDFPYICRKILINNLKLPKLLDIAGLKPWEVAHLDTMQLWKFGDYKSYTSLDLLATIFDIPTPKDDIDGSEVAGVYWREKDIKRIVTYCQKDVITVAQILLKFKGKDILSQENIIYID